MSVHLWQEKVERLEEILDELWELTPMALKVTYSEDIWDFFRERQKKEDEINKHFEDGEYIE